MSTLFDTDTSYNTSALEVTEPTDNEYVLQLLEKGHKLTVFGMITHKPRAIFNLAQRIWCLKEYHGITNIQKEMITVRKRGGGSAYVAQYSLIVQ